MGKKWKKAKTRKRINSSEETREGKKFRGKPNGEMKKKGEKWRKV